MRQKPYLPSGNSAYCWGGHEERHRQLQFGGICAVLGGPEGHGNFLENLELELSLKGRHQAILGKECSDFFRQRGQHEQRHI